MQTFLPYPDFQASALCLDDKRLGKQRIEVVQILKTLAGLTEGWKSHPAVRMWSKNQLNLAEYGFVICDEWIARGFTDAQRDVIRVLLENHEFYGSGHPSWFGDPAFHLSHQSNLVRKFPRHYRHFFPDVPDNLPYVWPDPYKGGRNGKSS